MRIEDYIAAGDPQAPAGILWKIYRCGDYKTRRRLAENPATPVSLLRELLDDPHPEVRASVASNSSAPEDFLDRLCSDPDIDVRLSLAQETSLPEKYLLRLLEDSNPYVCDFARSSLECREFEHHLRARGYVHEPGLVARLGELLVAAGLLAKGRIPGLVELARREKVNLGFLLVREKLLTRDTVVRALKLQSRIRSGKLSFEAAAGELSASPEARGTGP
ncbi:MAG: hypothetical protein IPM23_19210 [Candidatus Melainabacteria bacterium]|nr:hypothetical protein [Candidatus Melainabacteria bacterium]